MPVLREELHNLVEHLPEDVQKSAFDFLQYLIERASGKPLSWMKIDQLEADDEPLSEEELRQLNCQSGYVSGEDAKSEFGLQANLP